MAYIGSKASSLLKRSKTTKSHKTYREPQNLRMILQKELQLSLDHVSELNKQVQSDIIQAREICSAGDSFVLVRLSNLFFICDTF